LLIQATIVFPPAEAFLSVPAAPLSHGCNFGVKRMGQDTMFFVLVIKMHPLQSKNIFSWSVQTAVLRQNQNYVKRHFIIIVLVLFQFSNHFNFCFY